MSTLRRKRAMNVWRSAKSTRGTPAERYFIRRDLPWLVECAWLRFHPNCPHPAKHENGRWRGLYAPAVIALLLDPRDNIVGVQKIFITPDGDEAPLERPRITVGCIAGNAIHIHTATRRLVVANGLETAARAAVLFERPAWAASATDNLGYSMRLPALPLASDVIIAYDHHLSGMHAAEAAAARWRKEGRKVEIASPNRLGIGFNRVLFARGHHKATPPAQNATGRGTPDPSIGFRAIPPNKSHQIQAG